MVSSFFNTFSFAALTPAISTLPCMAVPPQTLKLHEFSMAGGLFPILEAFLSLSARLHKTVLGHSVHCIVSRQGVSAVQCRIRDFRCKEVINICDGSRLGCVGDLDVRVLEGQVVAIIVYGPGRFFGLFGQGGGLLHSLGLRPAIRGGHHPHRQALPAPGSPPGAEAAQALLTNAPAAFTAGAFAYAGGAVTAPPDS